MNAGCNLEYGGVFVEKSVMKLMYNNIENSWEFIKKATKVYEEEFAKTSKIGTPPKIDDIIERVLLDELNIKAGDEEKTVKGKKASKTKSVLTLAMSIMPLVTGAEPPEPCEKKIV